MIRLEQSRTRAAETSVRMLRAAILAISCAALVAGCNTVPGRVNGMIAKRLPAMLGPADHYDVRTSGSLFDLLRGKLDHVRIHGDNVALSSMPHVRSFDADATDIHANTRSGIVTGIGHTTYTLVMDQGDLENYMQAARPAAYRRGARISLQPAAIIYSDTVSTFGLETPFSVTGILTPHAGNAAQLDFVPSSGAFARIGVPLPLLKAAIARQNPVVDLSKMTYPVSITSTDVVNSALVVAGSADLSSLVGKDADTARPPRPHS